MELVNRSSFWYLQTSSIVNYYHLQLLLNSSDDCYNCIIIIFI